LRTRAGLRGLRVRAGAARFFLLAMGLLLLRSRGESCAPGADRAAVSSTALSTETGQFHHLR
jgi:hypothetical protein